MDADTAWGQETSTPTCGRLLAKTLPPRIFGRGAGTVLAATTLAEFRRKEPHARASSRRLTEAIESLACELGNTRAVCRKSYIHPVILDTYREGTTIQVGHLRLSSTKRDRGLTPEEWAVVNLLERSVRNAKIA
jgi:DNA topoisomerase-1